MYHVTVTQSIDSGEGPSLKDPSLCSQQSPFCVRLFSLALPSAGKTAVLQQAQRLWYFSSTMFAFVMKSVGPTCTDTHINAVRSRGARGAGQPRLALRPRRTSLKHKLTCLLSHQVISCSNNINDNQEL